MHIPNNDQEVLRLIYELSGNYPYNPPSYSAIREFTDSFPKGVITEFQSEPRPVRPEWQPEAPYPRIYTKHYKKTLLSTL